MLNRLINPEGEHHNLRLRRELKGEIDAARVGRVDIDPLGGGRPAPHILGRDRLSDRHDAVEAVGTVALVVCPADLVAIVVTHEALRGGGLQ